MSNARIGAVDLAGQDPTWFHYRGPANPIAGRKNRQVGSGPRQKMSRSCSLEMSDLLMISAVGYAGRFLAPPHRASNPSAPETLYPILDAPHRRRGHGQKTGACLPVDRRAGHRVMNMQPICHAVLEPDYRGGTAGAGGDSTDGGAVDDEEGGGLPAPPSDASSPPMSEIFQLSRPSTVN